MARYLFHLVAFLIALVALVPVRVSNVQAAPAKPLLVIVSGSSGMTDISTAMLRRAFQNYPTEYQPGKRLVPLNHPTGSELRGIFDRNVLGLEPDAVGAFWIDQRVRGQSEPPRTLPSVSLATRVVAALPGAITYVWSDAITDQIRALTIDGKSPTDGDYLLAR
jgi:hypothetical protein